MRTSLAPSVLLVFLSLITVAAHADSIDDFVLVGEGHTITYSLPVSAIVMDHPHGVTLSETAPTTIDGVSGYTTGSTYYVPRLSGLPEMIWYGPSSIDGGTTELWGPWVVSATVIPIDDPTVYYPDNLLVTFVPGTYNFFEYTSSAVIPYTLTITPEVSAVPEPDSLILAATGVLGVLGLAGVRSRRRTESPA
jgi:hypothetical protein